MKIVVLGSSSKGNSTFVELGGIKFLIDVGFPYRYIDNSLKEINEDIKKLDFVIITHSHSDHVESLYTFYRNNIPIYMAVDSFNHLKIKDKLLNINYIDDIDKLYNIDIIKIPISHDTPGFGYVFNFDNKSICYLTDTGVIYSKYFDLLKNKNIYLIESNHDVEMEMNGTKDYNTKIRNIGDTGHLSNDECVMYLNKFIGNNTTNVVLMHISKHDNTYELAYKTNREKIDSRIDVKLAYDSKYVKIEL